MISFFKNLELNKLNKRMTRSIFTQGYPEYSRGMTYVELIVVLGIFAMMTSVVLFNYKKFEEKVEIKVLANDITLKIVEAQNSSISGRWNSGASAGWKPSYGVYLDPSSGNNKSFIYFADLDNNGSYDNSGCAGECLSQISITQGNYLSRIDSYLGSTSTPIANPLSIVFKRPDSSAIFKSNGQPLSGFDYIQLTISSPSSVTARVKIYPSGRAQIN